MPLRNFENEEFQQHIDRNAFGSSFSVLDVGSEIDFRREQVRAFSQTGQCPHQN
jgi:hypothetical protein